MSNFYLCDMCAMNLLNVDFATCDCRINGSRKLKPICSDLDTRPFSEICSGFVNQYAYKSWEAQCNELYEYAKKKHEEFLQTLGDKILEDFRKELKKKFEEGMEPFPPYYDPVSLRFSQVTKYKPVPLIYTNTTKSPKDKNEEE